MLQVFPFSSESFAKVRADLDWVHYSVEGRWVVHDPIDERFFYLSEIEQLAISLLNGKRTTQDVVSQIRSHFPSENITVQWVDLLVAKFTAAGLVWHGGAGVTAIANAKSQINVFFLLRLASSLVGFRVRLIDPTFLVCWLVPIAMFLFHRWTMIAVGIATAVCGSACALAWLGPLGYGDRSVDLFQPSRWWIIVVLIAFIKTMHELGHLLACIRWGVHCRELGVLFLFFTPCPYCDTTEAWRLSSRWQRAAIAAGGIYVEVILSCVAAVFWLNAEGPMEKSISAWMMIICSVGTIAVNGNPLLKYDGYYIFVDLWRVPNLAQQSQRALWQCFVWVLGGSKPDFASFPKNIFLLASYGIVSGLYRIILMLTIIWVLWTVLEPIGLGFIAMLVTLSTIMGSLWMMHLFVFKTFAEFFRPKPIGLVRFLFFISALVALCVFFLFVPIDTFVRSRGFLELAEREPIYVTLDSQVKYVARGSRTLQANEPVVLMKSFDKIREQRFLESDLAQARRKYKLLFDSKSTDATGAFELPALSEFIRELEMKDEIIREELKKMNIIAAGSNSFYPTAPGPTNWLTVGGWSPDSSLSYNLLNEAWLPRGTALGWLARNNDFHVMALVTESDVRLLKLNMQAEFMCDSNPDFVFQGKIVEIASESIDSLPAELIGDRSLSVSRDERGKLVTETPHYLVTVQVTGEQSNWIRGSLVSIRFRVESSTIVEWIWRYVRMSIQIPL